ncbi:hypothetical protein GQ457_11G026600 [Hibiscus cannabinus]
MEGWIRLRRSVEVNCNCVGLCKCSASIICLDKMTKGMPRRRQRVLPGRVNLGWYFRIRQSVLQINFFVHGLEVQLWQSSRPQFDTLSVQEYSEKYADPIALHFVFLVHACLGSTAPNLALICCSIFGLGGKYARDLGGKICHRREFLQ